MSNRPEYAVSRMGHRWKVTYECQGSRFCYSTHDTKREAAAAASKLRAHYDAIEGDGQ